MYMSSHALYRSTSGWYVALCQARSRPWCGNVAEMCWEEEPMGTQKCRAILTAVEIMRGLIIRECDAKPRELQ